jgi:two-component system chemotaxis sensor kinase CheA
VNEFIEQFLIEARELVDQATDDLLALEGAPAQGERLDSAFRAFHTLKGSAGIIDFPAMERALHAAEEVLAQVRASRTPISARLIGDCLYCLDQVVQWLDAMEQTGEPPSDAEGAADAVAARFARDVAAKLTSQTADWLPELLGRHPEAQARAAAAVRYTPQADSFFRGLDPIAILGSAPGLLTVDFEPTSSWPPIETFDPFSCQIVLTALFDASHEAVAAALTAVEDQVEIRALGGGSADLSAAASELLAAQIAMLEAAAGEGVAGKLGAAVTVAVNVLRHAGRDDQAVEIERLAGAGGDVQAVVAALRAALAGESLLRPAVDRALGGGETAERAIRVDVSRIDALVRLAGELTVVKNTLGYTASLASQGGDPATLSAKLNEAHGQLGRLLEELQRSVLSIRVLPLRHVFHRFPRLVRDIGAELGKPVRLLTEGEDTEADKSIVESLFEPLLHVVRNAVGHGIEDAAVRARLAKPATGTVRIRARREGEHVLIEVSDDGGGIDTARVRAVALQRGVAEGPALEAMDDAQVADLIFAPGFSTVETVTGLSGRGVGMDAVRTAVERIGGRVGVESERGVGTTVRLTLPFTVMMSRVMTVEAGAQVFGVPLEAVVETVRVARDQIAAVGLGHAFVLRNRTIPVISLAETLQMVDAATRPDTATIVIAQVGGHLTGLEVDRVGERLDVMLKPMEGLLAGMGGMAGTTLLGDGRVLIVLDLHELLQ